MKLSQSYTHRFASAAQLAPAQPRTDRTPSHSSAQSLAQHFGSELPPHNPTPVPIHNDNPGAI